MKLIFFILGLLLLTVVIASDAETDDVADATAEDSGVDEEDDDMIDGMRTAAERVSTSCIFPSHLINKFPAGDEVEALIGFENNNDNDFHVEFVVGYLTSPSDRSYFIQNFTGKLYNLPVRAEEEICLVYRFKPDPNIEPRDYGLVLQVFYNSTDSETFLSTVFNSTVDVMDPATALDAKSVFLYCIILGLLALAGFGIFRSIQRRTRKSRRNAGKSTSSTTEEAPSNKDIDWDYISTSHKSFGRKPASSPQRRTSPRR
eukprot:NODE_3290_length_994_cov_887.232987_g3144_i0.p1 GENE.NODE_3290_length_994_cov_887.232987_g3144_i0~~NODE_3290_length_994_cov_887.232987_g3144_i0.p1  ORF type:complete len:259 (-),score=40.20 NODE_3290_length_994_cov_887.232987_g3144_i0:146-922(-)